MLGIRQPLDGPVYEKLEQAEQWCIEVMIDHYDRRLGMSDARIEPFEGTIVDRRWTLSAFVTSNDSNNCSSHWKECLAVIPLIWHWKQESCRQTDSLQVIHIIKTIQAASSNA